LASLYLNEELHADAFRPGARLAVWSADARHAAQVARVRTGERIGVGDGRGRIGWGRVVHVAANEVAIEADEIAVTERAAPRLVLVQALAKGDRDELAIQAATELGVAEVIPWQAARSVSVWKGEKAAKGLERWRGIVREASKQAIRAWVPEVGELASTKSLVEALRLASLAQGRERTLVLEPTAQASLVEVISRRAPADRSPIADLRLVVGPEGGIDDWELRELEQAGAVPVRLGAEVLRTSTAGPAAIAALQTLLGRW